MYRPLVKWTKERLEESKGSARPLKLRELTEEACEKFTHDPNFLRQEVYPIIADTIRAVMATTRRLGPGEPIRLDGAQVAGQPAPERVHPWREHTKAGWVLLVSMNRAMLKEAIGERKIQVDAGRRRILFLEALSKGLKNNEQTVGERYDADQIESLKRRYERGTGEADDTSSPTPT